MSNTRAIAILKDRLGVQQANASGYQKRLGELKNEMKDVEKKLAESAADIDSIDSAIKVLSNGEKD